MVPESLLVRGRGIVTLHGRCVRFGVGVLCVDGVLLPLCGRATGVLLGGTRIPVSRGRRLVVVYFGGLVARRTCSTRMARAFWSCGEMRSGCRGSVKW